VSEFVAIVDQSQRPLCRSASMQFVTRGDHVATTSVSPLESCPAIQVSSCGLLVTGACMESLRTLHPETPLLSPRQLPRGWFQLWPGY
jgi:hypothetical protein